MGMDEVPLTDSGVEKGEGEGQGEGKELRGANAPVNCENAITRYLRTNELVLNIYAFVFAFVGYFSMYAFRKPYTASKYQGEKIFGQGYKTIVVVIQLIGYTLSKFIGIKYVSEMDRKHRGIAVVILICVAETALLLFGAIPRPYNAIFMFINGLPLGMIWGLVYSYLEGRRWSEIIGTGMALSFVVASGGVKGVGQALLNAGVSQWWMPATAGAIFFVPLMVSMFFLESLPYQTEDDEEERTERPPMDHEARLAFCKLFGPGLVLTITFDVAVTAYRDYRDNFATEIWNGLGYEAEPGMFTYTELIVTVVLLVPIGLFQFFKNLYKAFMGYHAMYIVGCTLVILGCALSQSGALKNGLAFMVLTGIGIYAQYVPSNSVFFDLFIAVFRVPSNCGFVVVICDALGYLTSVTVLLVKEFSSVEMSWLDFGYKFGYVYGVVGIVFTILSGLWYTWKFSKYNSVENLEESQALCAGAGGAAKGESLLGGLKGEGGVSEETNFDRSGMTDGHSDRSGSDGPEIPRVEMEEPRG
jgi:hypothetical protein